jgi:hypothetical protein
MMYGPGSSITNVMSRWRSIRYLSPDPTEQTHGMDHRDSDSIPSSQFHDVLEGIHSNVEHRRVLRAKDDSTGVRQRNLVRFQSCLMLIAPLGLTSTQVKI